MSKHLADQRQTSTGGRVKAFMKIARRPDPAERPHEAQWHRPHHELTKDSTGASSAARLQQFLRIARGRLS